MTITKINAKPSYKQKSRRDAGGTKTEYNNPLRTLDQGHALNQGHARD